MARAYSDDLRCKLLEAHAAGAGSLTTLARQFRVSVPYAKKIHAHFVHSGSKQRTPQSRYGRLSRVDAAARGRLVAWVGEQPDLTLAELRAKLADTGVHVCKARVCQILLALGLRFKKNAARQRAR